MAIKIGTHDGSFHADEALACFLLKRLPEFANAPVVRSRNPSVLDECDIVVDVGGVYDHEKKRYDHHQRTFDGNMKKLDLSSDGKPQKKWTTKLSSAGLIYLHYGRQIIQHLCGVDMATAEVLYDQMYENFIEEIDAIDNGISQYDTDSEPRYRINTTVSSRVGRLNPSWLEEKPDFDGQFAKAMELIGGEFLASLDFYSKEWLPARDIVKSCIESRFEVDASGEICVLERSCPWKVHLFDLEEELSSDSDRVSIKYILYSDQHGKWRVQAIPVRPGSFTSRIALPEEWRGIRDDELSQKTGIKGCIFVHASGFIGGNETKDGALEMARRALHMGTPAPRPDAP